jgi:putative transposase
MARPPRLDFPGITQHVIQRGNNRSACFVGDADRRFYLRCLADSARERGCAIHAYVLMSNHVHLLATPPESGALAAMLQDLGRRYVRVINNIHGRTGTLWEGRYRASLVDSENYLLACHRYIELNPVRAGLVDDPGAYPWSSHSHYVGNRTNDLLTEHEVFKALGGTPAERLTAFKKLFALPMNEEINTIRAAVNSDSAVGSEQFLQELENALGRSVRVPRRGRPANSVTGKLL